jgi:ABC-type polysaccharide/polyol phosphate transport system ATPase subunit
MTHDTIVEVTDVSKTFVVPLDRRLRLKEYVVQPLRPRTYERNEALKAVSVTIDRGECFGIIGPNGSGKSTLLKVLAGIYRPDSGIVRVGGSISPFIELGVGFHPELSARENIEINATLLGLTRQEIRDRFDDIVAFSELDRFIDQKLKNYSSGMLMRLAYAIAIQVPFDILLLDEVLAVGDLAFQEKCFQTFWELRNDAKTVVFVSHNLHAIRNHCDRVMLLDNGVVEAVGPAGDVVDLYEEREQARVSADAHPIRMRALGTRG